MILRKIQKDQEVQLVPHHLIQQVIELEVNTELFCSVLLKQSNI